MKMNKQNRGAQKQDCRQLSVVRPQARLKRKSGFGLNEVIGIAAGIIIAVVVVIPGLQEFAGNILTNLMNWWNNMASSVFSTP